VLVFALNMVVPRVAGRTMDLLPSVPVLAINEVLVGVVARTAVSGG